MSRVSKSLLLDNYLTKKHNPHQRNSVGIYSKPAQCKSNEAKANLKIDMKIWVDTNPFDLAKKTTSPINHVVPSSSHYECHILPQNVIKILEEKHARSPIRANVNFFDADQLMLKKKDE